MRFLQTARLFTTARATMALHSGSDPSKLIFAPAGSKEHGQAEQFKLGTLHLTDLDKSPISQFHKWFSQAQSSNQIPHPEACALSTAQLPSGRVSSRMVYLKELDSKGGFVVYTNLGTSGKKKDLDSNGWASLLFFWEALQRQVRVEGKTTRLSREESQTYYDTRVRGSRIGAWASQQSEVLRPVEGVEGDDGRAKLEGWVKDVEERFEGQEEIPCPEFWGGLRLVPERVEFWQGRESRLHDRFVFERENAEGEWKVERLSP